VQLRKTRCRDMAVRNFRKCEVGRSVGRSVSHRSKVMADFLLKFSYFRCHGNRGWSESNFTCTVKFPVPENPLNNRGMSSIQAELWEILCLITAIAYHGSSGWSGVSLNDTIKLADPENPQFGANSFYVSSTMTKL